MKSYLNKKLTQFMYESRVRMTYVKTILHESQAETMDESPFLYKPPGSKKDWEKSYRTYGPQVGNILERVVRTVRISGEANVRKDRTVRIRGGKKCRQKYESRVGEARERVASC